MQRECDLAAMSAVLALCTFMHRHGLRVWDRVFGWRRRAEARATLLHARAHLPPGAYALDVGCGAGYALDVLASELGLTAFGCDVVIPPLQQDHFVRFDGRNLPYRHKSVDVVFLIFVLHHAEDPSVLLREASRVARNSVIVVEDTPRNALEQLWGSMHVRSFGRRHGIPWRGHVRDHAEWRSLFQAMEMPVLHCEPLGRFERLPPVSRTVFVLAPAAIPASVIVLPSARSRHAPTS